MAILAFFGGVQPSEYRSMTYRDGRRLATELMELHTMQAEARQKVEIAYVTALMKAQGARLG